jgi:hypothetical protein
MVREEHAVSCAAVLPGGGFYFLWEMGWDGMNFELAHTEFIRKHEKQRRGEALRRLKEGHGHAECLFLEVVWWPAFGSLELLSPEYEINDFKDGLRYLDFALISGNLRLAIEIDGYVPHLQKLSRAQFSDQLLRQNHLIIDGWKVLRFSYDDVKERPRTCIQLVQQFIGRWHSGETKNMKQLSAEDKDILRFAMRMGRSFTPNEICNLLNIEKQKARKILHRLLDLCLLNPGGKGKERVRCYQISKQITSDDLWT